MRARARPTPRRHERRRPVEATPNSVRRLGPRCGRRDPRAVAPNATTPMMTRNSRSSEQGPAENQGRETEVDDEPGDIDECGDERRRRARWIEAESPKKKGQQGSSEGAERHHADQRRAHCGGDERPMGAVVVPSELLPEYDPGDADDTKDHA